LVWLYDPILGKGINDTGAKGIIICEAPGCVLGFQWIASLRYMIELSEIPLPIGVISFYEFEELYEEAFNTTTCTITGLGANEWVIMEGAFIIVTQVIFGILYSICIIYSVYLLVDLWKSEMLKFNIASVCIILELIGGALRMAWLFDNPLTFKYAIVNAIMFSLHIPCSIITGVLMIFFWQDATNFKSKKVEQFLSRKFFYAAIVFIVLIVLFELAIDIFYGTFPGGQTNNLVWFVIIDSYSVVWGLMAIFYFIYCSKALYTIKKNWKK